MSDTEFRIDVSDDYDIIRAVELRQLDGGVLHLTIDTVYKYPEVTDAGSGVVVKFGNSEATVSIPNLDQLYQIWAEAGRYAALVVYIPVKSLQVAPILQRTFEPVVIEPSEPSS